MSLVASSAVCALGSHGCLNMLARTIKRFSSTVTRGDRSLRHASATPSWTEDVDSPSSLSKLFNPTDDHAALREMVRAFAEREVEEQATEHNRTETFNVDLFRKLGSNDGGLGVLGLTVPEEYGGTGMIDATAVSIVHEELSYVDPAFCLSYLGEYLRLCVSASSSTLTRITEMIQRIRSCSRTIWQLTGVTNSSPNSCHAFAMAVRSGECA